MKCYVVIILVMLPACCGKGDACRLFRSVESPCTVFNQPFIYVSLSSPIKVSFARQAKAPEMGGQHETGGVDPKSPSVPVQ